MKIVLNRIEVPDTNNVSDTYLAIDLGIDNLATLTNNIGLQPIVINGKILKYEISDIKLNDNREIARAKFNALVI